MTNLSLTKQNNYEHSYLVCFVLMAYNGIKIPFLVHFSLEDLWLRIF